MTALLDQRPFGARDDARLLSELNMLTRHHLAGCEPYARIWPNWHDAPSLAELPFLHVGAFKEVTFRTQAAGIQHRRTVKSSATTSGVSSQIVTDDRSAALQARSAIAILEEFVGAERRPLLVVDDARLVRSRDVPARIAAAMSLKPLATDIQFIIGDAADPSSLRVDRISKALDGAHRILVYGFTYMLWQAWVNAQWTPVVRDQLARTQVHFIHSGGWKRLEAIRVDRETFDGALLSMVAPGSSVLDYYGLVEQMGILFPLCGAGFRHAPVWAAVLVRDPYTLETLAESPGQVQSLNSLAWGAPYHSVLTEDMARMAPGNCPCGRSGQRFELFGRILKAELRGCANVA